MELLTLASWLLYLLLIALLAWGILQMRTAIKRTVPPPASLTSLEREMFIPFDLDDIVREAAVEQRQGAKEVCRQLGAFFSVNAGSTAAELRHGFALFDPLRMVPAHYTPEKITEKEDRFLSLWRRILHKANFKPLSPEELDFALAEDYLSTLPIEVNFNNLDPDLLSRFNAKHPLPEGQRAHKNHDRIWVYRRGLGVDKTTSYFFVEKANLLIQLVVQWLCARFLPPKPTPTDKPPVAMGSHRGIGRVTLADVVDFKKNGIKKSLLEQNTLQEPTFREIVLLYRAIPPKVQPAAAPADGSHTTSLPVTPAASEPSTPRSTPATPRQDDKAALSSTSLSPPGPGLTGTPPIRSPSSTLLSSSHRHREHKDKEHHHPHKERKEKSSSSSKSSSATSPSPSAPSSSSASPSSGSKTHRQLNTFNPLAIQIKTFINIPMADLEIVLPEKTVRMRPLDVVKFVATGAVAILTALTNMKQDASAMLAGGLLVMLIGLASKVYIDYTTALREYDNLLTRSLYDKSLNNNTGAVIYLVDQVAQQETKEAVLSYCLLLNKGPCNSKKLDRRAEKFLYKMSRRGDVRQDIDFDVDDALGKLVHLGVVKRESDHTYRALPPTEALAVLKARWPEQLEREDKHSHEKRRSVSYGK